MAEELLMLLWQHGRTRPPCDNVSVEICLDPRDLLLSIDRFSDRYLLPVAQEAVSPTPRDEVLRRHADFVELCRESFGGLTVIISGRYDGATALKHLRFDIG
jgi:hypothetical protein